MQRSVQQQNASVEAGIRAAAEKFSQGAAGFAWLHAILRANRMDADSGLLVRLTEIPDQGGQLVAGLWLTSARRFIEFQVSLSRESGELQEVERFLDVTSSMAVESGQRGTGQSFGFLALKVLAEAHDG
ncbi:hypothetical protein ABT392_05480 [Paucibacter sp. JuS9]|uniref:hypothetical protein n=1 Tax=Paucibacter sp. JuS9 TaxID=3228748 RepID=UPI00375709AD